MDYSRNLHEVYTCMTRTTVRCKNTECMRMTPSMGYTITCMSGSLSVLMQSMRGRMIGLNLPGSEEREMRAPAIQLRTLMLSCCCSSWS